MKIPNTNLSEIKRLLAVKDRRVINNGLLIINF